MGNEIDVVECPFCQARWPLDEITKLKDALKEAIAVLDLFRAESAACYCIPGKKCKLCLGVTTAEKLRKVLGEE